MTASPSPGPRLTRAAFLKGAAGLIGATVALSAENVSFAARLSAASMARAPGMQETESPLVVYFGTGAMGQGIHVFEMDKQTGFLTERSLTEAPAPGWIALDPGERFVYGAISGNQLSSYAIDGSNASVTPLNEQSTGSGADAHISVDPSGRFVVGASWTPERSPSCPSKRTASLARQRQWSSTWASPGRIPTRPSRARIWPRSIHRNAGSSCLTWDWIASMSTISIWRVADSVANSPPYLQFERGRGPRHIAFHPNGRVAHVINELSSIMTVVTWDSTSGTFHEIQAESTLPEDWTGKKQSAEVAVHPSGQFVYGSNRGSGGDSDDIVIFRVDQSTGRSTLVGHVPTLGRVPRNFAIDPSGRFLICAHQDSNNVVPFTIDQDTGLSRPPVRASK